MAATNSPSTQPPGIVLYSSGEKKVTLTPSCTSNVLMLQPPPSHPACVAINWQKGVPLQSPCPGYQENSYRLTEERVSCRPRTGAWRPPECLLAALRIDL